MGAFTGFLAVFQFLFLGGDKTDISVEGKLPLFPQSFGYGRNPLHLSGNIIGVFLFMLQEKAAYVVKFRRLNARRPQHAF